MTLKIWTAAEAALITRTFGASLKSFRPDVPRASVRRLEGRGRGAAGGWPGRCRAGLRHQAARDRCRRAGRAPKNRTVSSLRETPLKSPAGGWYLTTFDPAIIGSEPDKKEVIDWDVRLAVRLMKTGGLMPEIGEYEWVNDFAPMIEKIEARHAKTGKAVDVTMDTETMGFYP